MREKTLPNLVMFFPAEPSPWSAQNNRLKSGGPPMTVEKVTQDQAVCHWFENKRRHTELFSLVLINKARTEAS
jgi:uncharacterized protein YodC (DUF2158 family)